MKTEEQLQELTTEKTNFKREIGVFGGVSIIGGIMIGSGIFYLGSYVLERTGMNSGLALICWIVAGLISLFGGLCYAELGTAMPKAGGRVVYLNEAYHPVVGFMAGFTDWLIGGPGSIAAVAIAMMTVLKPYFHLGDFGVKAAAIVLIIAITVYNLIGVKVASFVQNISMVAKLIPVAIIMIAAIFVGKISPDLSFASASAFAKETNTNLLSMVAIAIVAALWAYEGWSNLNTVAEEIKNPKRNLPLALIIGIGGVTIIYTLFNFCIMKVLPHDEIVAMINSGDLYLGTAVARKVLGGAGVFVVSAGMVLAMFGTANGMVLAQPRMYYAMAEEGHFFKSFAKLHPKYKVPHVPIIVQGVLSIILVLVRNLNQLTDMVVLSAMVFNALVILAVPILRHKYPQIERPYKVWFYPVSIIVTALIFIALIVNSAIEDPFLGFIGLGVPAIGAVVYFLFDLKLKREKEGK
ncbi:MAG TPA: amino acid permease [Candidatus Dorea intestinavium]|nr:amino acid permease [Candidatus Dorea intestinavium]